jgi:hypothetical protein
MIRFLLRLIGLLTLAGGFATLVVDGTRSIAASQLRLLPFRDLVAALFPGRLPLLQDWVTRDIHPLLWHPVLTTILGAPAALVLAAIGLLFLRLAQPRKPLIGHSNRP